jgi:hypothetical protein
VTNAVGPQTQGNGFYLLLGAHTASSRVNLSGAHCSPHLRLLFAFVYYMLLSQENVRFNGVCNCTNDLLHS